MRKTRAELISKSHTEWHLSRLIASAPRARQYDLARVLVDDMCPGVARCVKHRRAQAVVRIARTTARGDWGWLTRHGFYGFAGFSLWLGVTGFEFGIQTSQTASRP